VGDRLPTVTVLVALCLTAGCSGGISRASAGTAAPAADATPAPTSTATTAIPPGLPTSSPPAGPSSVPASEPSASATSTPPSAPTTSVPAPVDPPPPIDQLRQVRFELVPVAELEWPVGIAWRDGDPAPYVIGQLGEVWRIGEGGQAELVLDLRARTSVVEPAASERGLLGIVFGPDGRMYLDFTDTNGDTMVASWAMSDDGRPVEGSEQTILTATQPGPGHNGGGLAFDRAGNLLIGFGDGGGSNGDDARDMASLMGTIVRVKPRSGAPGYDVPADNPFVGRPDVAPEIYAFGLRNPWRLSVDSPTGDIWLGDVGNSTTEEIDRIPAGQSGLDFGWNLAEGSRPIADQVPPDAVPPVFEWGRDQGVAAVGGFVYRGQALPGLRGAYVFGDLTGQMWFLGADGVAEHNLDPTGIVSFGQDAAGELYIVSIFGDVLALRPAAG